MADVAWYRLYVFNDHATDRTLDYKIRSFRAQKLFEPVNKNNKMNIETFYTVVSVIFFDMGVYMAIFTIKKVFS